MSEVLLRTNHRALAMGMILPGLILVGSVTGLIWALTAGRHWAFSLAFASGTMLALWMLGELVYAAWQPRLAVAAGDLLVFLEPTRPTKVPLEIVECFFLGQGPSELPRLKGREPQTQNVIVRLAESAVEWKHRDVKPAFGHWCEGYITLRGSWCEPITPAIMARLNRRLAELHHERKAAS
ncbi:MAG TPA: hypothetical protein VFB80_05620 [Pirellulaceae bacterium]|nr:hypothetical protein [Pirellulaceae bacterium]